MNSAATLPALKIQRTFAAARERVWSAWTDPAQVKIWAGPEGCRATEVEIDLRAGGQFRFVMVNGDGEFCVRGEYREVTPPARLVHTWQWDDDPFFDHHETLVTVEFVETGDTTEVRVTHENLPTAESRSNHEYGWTGCLEKLANLLNP